ncbi:MAG: methionine synthase [Elusimicrobia bacterium]|nr:methionine synthase [Candidatus Obscuribacterium magneticum]
MNLEQYKKTLSERILIFDGAMGTNLQKFNPTLDDYQGKEGCMEILNLTHPEWVKDVHASFYKVGCDVVETNSFGANRIVLGEYGLAERAIELNRKAAQIAREAARDFSTPDHPRYVAGSIGPGTKLPSLGHTTFDTLRESYTTQCEGLLEGGVDILLIETCQDLLQVKAAVNGALDAMRKLRIQVPLNVQVTIESTGTMLVGSDIATAINVIECFPVDTIGINCATGPFEMSEHVRALGQLSTRFISVLPNAGLPENVGGKAVYKLTPQELASNLVEFATKHGVNVVGGCCGTTPDHLKAVVEAVQPLKPLRRQVKKPAQVSSLYLSTPLRQEPAPLIVGERTNANGSKQFRDLLNANDYDALVTVAKEQEEEGAHVLDVCTAYVGRDESKDMFETIKRFSLQTRVPLMIDSTNPDAIETALKLLGGKPIVNSINLEDGEERLAKICPLLKTYGAAVVALTIDEQGMAKTADKKLEVAKRIYKLSVEKYGLAPSDLIFDPLTFTLGSGDEEYRKAARETLEGIRRIKKEFPDVHTLLGVSNISFGLAPVARAVLNSVFLHYAVEAGLDAAIINTKRIMPLFKIDEKGRELARQLIFDERKPGFDPLKEFMATYADAKETPGKAPAPKSIEEELKYRIINGNKQNIEKVIEQALRKYPSLDIINNILLAGMRKVGELFGSGQIQLPFVLQSAETMRAAVKILEPHLPKNGAIKSRGKMVLATVKGDVHDIGKNLVDIILTNNGYTIINLGIKQPIDNIIKAAEEHKPDAIGLSGLLVKSTAVMKEDLEELNKRNLKYKVILGGAALTRKFVEEDLRSLYKGKVFYASDAFEGLRLMDELTQEKAPPSPPPPRWGKRARPEKSLEAERNRGKGKTSIPHSALRLPHSKSAPLPKPPFFGTRVVRGIDVKEVFPYINQTALLKVRWGYKRVSTNTVEEYERLINEQAKPLYEKWKNTAVREGLFRPQVVYGYFPCQSDGDSLIIYGDDQTTKRQRFLFPRQKREPYLCVSDFFRPLESDEMDVIGMMIVTIGPDATPKTNELYKKNAYTDYLFLHGLSVETAEALAEYWHKRMREELHIAGADAHDIRDLFHQKYQGSRYSFGYPACPNLEDQAKLVELLDPARIGVTLSETFQLQPEQSVSALIVPHPAAKYFSIE